MTTPDTQEKCPQCGSDKLLAKYRTEYLCKSWNYGDAYNEFVQSDLCKEREKRIKAYGELLSAYTLMKEIVLELKDHCMSAEHDEQLSLCNEKIEQLTNK